MGDRADIHIFDNKSEMTDFTVAKWKELFRESIHEKDGFAAALSGGSTPRDFYRKLSGVNENLIWSRTHIFLADERFVSFTDSESNYGMLDNLLLSKVNIPPENCHPIPVLEASPENSAKKYEEEIRTFFKLEREGLPVFDLIMLGIGEDGHTASLFPGTDALRDRTRIASAVYPDGKSHNRITLTLQVINNSKNIIFLAAGKFKAAVIRRVLKENDASLPAALVKPKNGKLLFLLDREAGSCL